MMNLQHLHLPKKQDWMTLEESADNKMDSLLMSLMNALDEHVMEKEFFMAIDFFYHESKRISLRNRRTEFDKIVLNVIEALIREKFKQSPYQKYYYWLFDFGHKNEVHLQDYLIPKELTHFLQTKKNLRVEGVLDLFVKRQNPQWFNPYLNYIGLRPEEIFECKILFKNIAQDLLRKQSIELKNQSWKDFLSHLCINQKEVVHFQVAGHQYLMTSRKQLLMSGESIELVLLEK